MVLISVLELFSDPSYCVVCITCLNEYYFMMHLNLINSSEPPAKLLSCQHGQVIGQYKHGSRDFLTGTPKNPGNYMHANMSECTFGF